MFKKRRYLFNPETLAFEIHKISPAKRFSRGFMLFLLSIPLSLGYYWLYAEVFHLRNPKIILLEQRSTELHSRMAILNKRYERYNQALIDLQIRDNNIYRPIFGMEEIPSSIRNEGIAGVGRYSKYEAFMNSSIMVDMERRVDMLYKKAYIQSRSYDEVSKIAQRIDKLSSCVPNIPPVDLELMRISSSFGYRVDPVRGGGEFHSGQDFAPKNKKSGASVHATGDGKVIDVKYNFWGYGNEVLIDHGFGYQTRYAHLLRPSVRKGDLVLKGEEIGLMGSSGKSTGVHLHYEVIYKQQRVNPYNYYDSNFSGERYREFVKGSHKSAKEEVEEERRER